LYAFAAYALIDPFRVENYIQGISLYRRDLVALDENSVTACGFDSSESFSRACRSRFNLSPTQDRSAGRIPFHFRSFPSHAGLPDGMAFRGQAGNDAGN